LRFNSKTESLSDRMKRPCKEDQVTRAKIEQMVENEVAPAELLFADGFDECILGLHWQTFNHETCVVYDRDKMLKKLMDDDMTYEDALEYFDFNIAGAYAGPHTPIYCLS